MPKIIGGSLVEHRAQVRVRVFEALVDLMAERPFAAVTMADLAERAGVGRTALYNHFADREAVLVAYAGEETRSYVARLEADLAATDDPVERLRVYVRHHRDFAESTHLGFGPEVMGVLSRESLTELRQHVHDVERVLRRVLEEGREAGVLTVVDLDEAVLLVHACLQRREVSREAAEQFVLGGLGVR
jgi:AcrR family transcriptional regulator